MIVTDYNEMNVEEIVSIYENLNVTFLIEDGKIVKANWERRIIMSLEMHKVLTECGICRHSAGMFYTIDCIEIILKLDPSKKIKICDVYKEVGKKYGRTGNTVAGLVRNTLKTVDFSKEISRKYFGGSGKKTSQYLFDFADKWKEESKEKEQTNEGKN